MINYEEYREKEICEVNEAEQNIVLRRNAHGLIEEVKILDDTEDE